MKSILVLKLDGIGDFALALPALRGLWEEMPGGQLDVVVSSLNAGWREIVPWIRSFYMIDFGGYRPRDSRKPGKLRLLAQQARLGLELPRQRYDAAIDLRTVPGDWRGKVQAWLSGAPIRIGGPGAGAWALTQVTHESAVHQSDRLAERLRAVMPSLKKEMSGLVSVSRRIPRTERPRLVLHPGAGNAAKRWPQEYWRAVVQRLAASSPGLDFTLLGGAEDEARLREIAAGRLSPAQVHISTSLRETMQTLADADLLLGLDSAAPHLAFLVGTPAITIFSAANNPAHWKALGDNTVLFTPIECSPCQLPRCKWETHRCMEAITPADVLEAIRTKLRASGYTVTIPT